jgi:hypothetical protein
MTFGAVLDTGGLSTTYHLEYESPSSGAARSDDTTAADQPRPSSISPTMVEIRIENVPLVAQSRYRYRIVALNAAGKAETSDRNATLG